MKSRTSFFNLTALRKSITRFYPVWVLYTLGLLLCFFALADNGAEDIAVKLALSMPVVAWINAIYAALSAMCLLGDLFKTRLCSALHAFPIRREGWLLTNLTAGMLFSLVPNVLFCLLTWTVAWEYAYMSLLWLAVMTLQYIFFFGTAVLSAMCAGNRLGMLAIYGIIHLITVFLFGVADVFYMPQLYGVALDEAVFERLFPLYRLSISDYVVANYTMLSGFAMEVFNYKGVIAADWVYLGICAGVGILCMALSLLVYRCRRLERAGDFMSLKPLSPIFTVIISVACGAVLYLIGSLLGIGRYVFVIVGLAIGYFAAQMLLKRTLRVFGKKSLLGFGIVTVVFFGSIGLSYLDPLNIAGWVPELDEVKSAAVHTSDTDGYLRGEDALIFSREEDICAIRELHGELLENKPQKNGSGALVAVRVSYQLQNGKTVTRYYETYSSTAVSEKVRLFLGDVRYIFSTDEPENEYGKLAYVVIRRPLSDKGAGAFLGQRHESSFIEGLMKALIADGEEGNLAPLWGWENHEESVYYLELRYQPTDEERKQLVFHDVGVIVRENATNTLTYLNEYFNSN